MTMPKKRTEKRIITLESSFENILVCNAKNQRPYIETFYYEAENITQEKLGTLFGILEISDDSEDSSYIVNYLISVIRKEYFSKPKRGAVESLEAALHKANLALSKLAEHGSLAWLGKLNAIIAVIEKNNLHLSQAGHNSALLLRNKVLTDISEGLAGEETEIHPLKTFVNVTSGRLENKDRLIITSEVLFDIFSFEEIKKSALRFSNEEFLQFIRTALSNEVPRAAVLLINMQEKEEIIESQPVPEVSHVNVFSQTAFSRQAPLPKSEPVETEEILEVSKQQNGHLYIKQSEITSESPDASFTFFSNFQKKIKTFRPNLKAKISSTANPFSQSVFINILKSIFNFSHKIFSFILHGLNISFLFIWKLLQIGYYKIKAAYEKRQREKISTETIKQIQEELQTKNNIFKKLIPNFSLLTNLASRFTLKQKISAFVAIILIFVIPYFIVKFEKNYTAKKEMARIQSIVPPPPPPLINDKNVQRLENLGNILEKQNVFRIINLNEKFFAITEKSILDLETKDEFTVPQDLEKIDLAVPMEDLQIILIMNKTNNKIFAFSPVNKKFQTNSLILPENSKIVSSDTYLTYLYLVDKDANQIYRYPRAEGGFGEKVNWKKDESSIQDSISMAINENVFLTDGKNVQKFFRGQKIDFTIENTPTPILPEKIWTKRDNENLYLLDTTNSRIVKLDKDGKIIVEYYHPEIAMAVDFSVSEEKNEIIFSTPNTVKSFSLN